MYKNIFDSHAHYDDEQFDLDRNELLVSFENNGVSGVVCCGVDIEKSKIAVGLSHKYDFVYSAVGFHPLENSEYKDGDLEIIKELAKDPKCVAIGEIGLDYHYEKESRENQLFLLEKQIELAKDLDLPILFHDRESHEDTLNILKKYKPKGVLHCFSGSVEMAKEIIKLGMYIGLGGAVTFKNAVKPCEVAKFVPSDRLLLETDAPYMTPVPFRGKRCDSLHIPYTAEKIAELRGVTAQEILDLTDKNARTLFNLG
ncbi:MAG: TatD family hydrolase [Clostridia bacterium]|nr:TatD family hydrolase [Clostridia bacterium]